MTKLVNNLKRRFWAASISKKILLIVAACSLLSLGLITASSVFREFQIVSQRESDKLSSMAGILAGNSVAALRFDDQLTATEHLSSLRSEPNITCAAIYSPDGKIFAQYQRDAFCEIPTYQNRFDSDLSSTTFSYTQDIELNGAPIGAILLKSDNQKLLSQLITNLVITAQS